MREILFIKQNKEKWLATEKKLNSKKGFTTDELSDLYGDLLDDLSFSQTYYPNSNTTLYLNSLVVQIYKKIYKTKRFDKNRFVSFFKEEVPKVAYKHRKTIYFSFALFLFFVFLGMISAHYDLNFVRSILGNHYVDETLKNIKNGDPMAVYKSGSNWGSAIAITLNNLSVALRCFLFGLLGGIFTFYVGLENAVMVGAFQYLFYQEGVFVESLKGIWLHGAMEVFSIIITMASGFILAKSLLFPKTYSRIYSLKIGFKESLKLFIGTSPFFIVAGFIEGYITRYSNTMPLFLNILIIFGNLIIISYYFLIYPLKFKNNDTI